MKFYHYVMLAFLFFGINTLNAQEKQIAKGDEYLQKAISETENSKKNELLQKALAEYKEAKLGKEMNLRVAEAFFEVGDLTNAAKFYLKCDKEPKKEGYDKIGAKYIEQAFESEKEEAKIMKKALDSYTRGSGSSEGCKAIGNAYYDKGNVEKALSYYTLGGLNNEIQKVAVNYEGKGEKIKAAEIYAKMNTPEGNKKAGDIYFDARQYSKAFEFYNASNDMEGIKKYSEILYAEGKTEEADGLSLRLVDYYKSKQKLEEVDKLAEQAVNRGNYNLAASIYEKSESIDNAKKYKAYGKLSDFSIDSAKHYFTAIGNKTVAQSLTANYATIQQLEQLFLILKDIRNGQPAIGIDTDPETKQVIDKAVDVRAREKYYADNKGNITDQIYKVSDYMAKITNPEMKKVLIQKMLTFKACGKILDPKTFAKKLQKAQVTAADAHL